jgi:hypothetical protein
MLEMSEEAAQSLMSIYLDRNSVLRSLNIVKVTLLNLPGQPNYPLSKTEMDVFQPSERSSMLVQPGKEPVAYPGDGAVTPTTPSIPCPPAVDRYALREAVVRVFDRADLEILCADIEAALRDDRFDMDVSLDIVGYRAQLRNQVLELVEFLDNRGLLAYMVKVVRQHRPGII